MSRVARRRGAGFGRVALGALLAVCAALFVYRGPYRAAQGGGSYDLVWMYSASRAWATGGNPYDIDSADAAFVSGGGPTTEQRFRPLERAAGASGLIYPPTTFVVMAPVGLLPWKAATLAWGAINVLAFGGAVWALLRIAGLRAGESRAIALCCACLAFGPVHTSIAFGQTAMLPVALVLLAQVAASRGRPALAGALLAVACALKPQLAGLFVVLEALRGRWRVVAFAAAAGAAIAGVGAGALWLRGIDWPSALRANVQAFAQSGVGSPTSENWLRFQMVNLQYPLHELIASRAVVAGLTWGVVGALLGALALATRPERAGRAEGAAAPADNLLAITVVACASLMAVYHRFYDAALLLPALAYVAVASGRDAWARVLPFALLIGVFLLNGTAALHHLSQAGGPLESLTGTALWRVVLMPHQAWAILLLGALAIALRSRPAPSPRP